MTAPRPIEDMAAAVVADDVQRNGVANRPGKGAAVVPPPETTPRLTRLSVVVGVVLLALIAVVAIVIVSSGGAGEKSATTDAQTSAIVTTTVVSTGTASTTGAGPTTTVAAPAAVPVTTGCSGPVKLILDHFYPDLVQGGNGTPPVFDTGGKRYCLTHLATYHWNGGAGAPAGGTFTLLDSNGKTVGGPWKAIATPGTGGTLSGWEVDATPTPFLIDGSYKLIDSDPSTLSWSKASAGAGFVRVWGTDYIGA